MLESVTRFNGFGDGSPQFIRGRCASHMHGAEKTLRAL